MTQALYGVPGVPATCFLLSVEQALAGFVAGLAAVLAAATTHALNGVPGVPETCFLLSAEQALSAARFACAKEVELEELVKATVFAAATTHALNGVRGVPGTCFLLSVEQARVAVCKVAEVASAAAVTQALNGVPGVPGTCSLLSVWQKKPYALACIGRVAFGPATLDGMCDVPRLLGGVVDGGPVVTPDGGPVVTPDGGPVVTPDGGPVVTPCGGPPGWLEVAAIASAGPAPSASATVAITTL